MLDLLDIASGLNDDRVTRLRIVKVIEPNLATEALENANALQVAEMTLSVMDVALRTRGPEGDGLLAGEGGMAAMELWRHS